MFVMPPLHPILVHVPIVMLIFSLLFELAGRALDADWWRRAAFAMLVIGVIGAGAAVLTGRPSGDRAEHQGVAERAVDEHEEAGRLTLWLALGALLARLIAVRPGPARGAIATLALLLQIAAAVSVGVAGYRGGLLVFEHGAAVRVHGHPVPSDGPAKTEKTDEKD